MKILFLTLTITAARLCAQNKPDEFVLNGNAEVFFNPTSAFEFLRINRPNQYPGAMPYTLSMSNVPNGDGTYNSPLVSGFNPYGSIDSTQSGIYYSLEPDYRPGGALYKEAHLEVSLPDGTQSRLYSDTFVQGDSLASSTNQWDFRCNTFFVSQLTGNPYFALATNGISFVSPDGSNGWRFEPATEAGITYLEPNVVGAQTLQLRNWNTVNIETAAAVNIESTLNAQAYTANGTPGLSITKTVKGSDGNSCTMTFTSGLLTATTCP